MVATGYPPWFDFASLRSAKSMGVGFDTCMIFCLRQKIMVAKDYPPWFDFASLRSAKSMVAKGGIEPPTQGFSVLCSTN